ncbi:hypothetical protein B0O99DRAFT_644575, partial [Bisporella sp. PMI_857]
KRENRTFAITQQNPYLTALFPQLIYGHVTYLSQYLSEIILRIESANEQPIPTSSVRTNEPCIVLTNVTGLRQFRFEQGSRRL